MGVQAVCEERDSSCKDFIILPLLSRIQRECAPLEKVEKKAKADGSGEGQG